MGESERRLREVFEAARADAKAGRVVVVFLDEVRGGQTDAHVPLVCITWGEA